MTTGRRQNGEIRDAVHGFVRIESDEWPLLDSPYLQRLRNIHQLAMTYLVYPGATHKRFEHSLGVMEMAGRVYDVITAPQNIHPSFAGTDLLPSGEAKSYWRKVVRMAALCHDIGHLPFSHAAEKELLPKDSAHENISASLILSQEMKPFWDSMNPCLKPLDVAKVAVGPKYLSNQDFSDWERLLYDVIGHEALGADRMDYLLRDSLHTGVAYGRFDHLRLLETIRLLPLPVTPNRNSPALGLELGGIHTAEGLLLARYFMFMQVYFHGVRVAYDLHLQDFLMAWVNDPQSPKSQETLPTLTDSDILLAIRNAAENESAAGHDAAQRILYRRHFRIAHILTRTEKQNSGLLLSFFERELVGEFGAGKVRTKVSRLGEAAGHIPVLLPSGDIESSRSVSDVLPTIPQAHVGFVFVDQEIAGRAQQMIAAIRHQERSAARGGDNEPA